MGLFTAAVRLMATKVVSLKSGGNPHNLRVETGSSLSLERSLKGRTGEADWYCEKYTGHA